MKNIIVLILSISFSFAGLYDDLYLVNSDSKKVNNKEYKELMHEDFDKIIRFKPVFFDSSSNEIKDESQKYLDEISKIYEEYKDRDIKLTIIGYTDHVQSKIEKANQSSWFRIYPNDLTLESSKKIALKYANYVQDELVNKGMSKNIITVEEYGGLDNLFTRATKEGREHNYRAMITLYISDLETADRDNDGVINTQDKCSFTPKGHNVNKDGCSTILNVTINYNALSSSFTDDSFVKLTNVTSFMKRNLKFKVLIYGYTDIVGTKYENQVLSEKRALSIRNYFIQKGINSSRISMFGSADSNPVQSNDTPEGRQANRRVEIKLY